MSDTEVGKYVLYTSNFAKHGKDPRSVAITVRPPPFLPGIKHLDALAPTWKMVADYKDGRITAEVYELKYRALLERKGDRETALACLPSGSIMLCYEKPGEFCHRHIAAAWLMEVKGGGVEIKEME